MDDRGVSDSYLCAGEMEETSLSCGTQRQERSSHNWGGSRPNVCGVSRSGIRGYIGLGCGFEVGHFFKIVVKEHPGAGRQIEG